jgi:large subunit ribosomal protein L25
MATMNLSAQKREDLSNSSTKTQRKKGNIPGIFYHRDSAPVSIYVKDTALNPFIYTSEVRVINLQIEGTGKGLNCILKDIQFDPVSDKAIHFDLLGISENEKIKVEIPLKMVGAPIGVRDGGVIQQSVHSIEIECLPSDIPAHIDIHIENLNIGDSVHVGDIETKNFVILDNADTTIVAVVPPAVEVVAAPVEGETAAAEPEVIAKGKKDEEGEGEEKK